MVPDDGATDGGGSEAPTDPPLAAAGTAGGNTDPYGVNGLAGAPAPATAGVPPARADAPDADKGAGVEAGAADAGVEPEPSGTPSGPGGVCVVGC